MLKAVHLIKYKGIRSVGFRCFLSILADAVALDEHTLQNLAIHPRGRSGLSMVVEAAIARYGVPEHLRNDNGPGFYRHPHARTD